MKHRVSILIATIVMSMSAASVAFAAELPVKPSGVAPEAFPASTTCVCHQDLADTWKNSMHAKAISDPVYQAKKAEANEATDGQLGQFCDTCHAPGATMTGEIAAGGALSAGTGEGVNCSWCHQVSGMAEGEPGNTSHMVSPVGVMRAQIKDPKSPHQGQYSELHTSSKFCGGCHNVNHPVNGMHLESTYREWEAGPYAAEGTQCQDCHMSASPDTIGPGSGVVGKIGPQRDGLYSMTFWGANVELGDKTAATAMLKKAARVEVEAPEILAAGDSAEVPVTITNIGAGHYLPTGLTEVREMWLEVYATAADGTQSKLGERRFGTILEDKDGNSPVELWVATKIKSDDRIAPRESVTTTVAVEMPQDADSTVISAKLLYRSTGDALAQKAKTNNPVTEMAVAEQSVYSSEAARKAAAQETAPQAEPNPRKPITATLVVALVVILGAVAGAVWFVRKRNR